MGILDRRRMRRHMRDIASRQLAMFETEHGELVRDAREARRRYHDDPDPASAQEHYGRADELAEDVEDLLHTMCSSFAGSLEDAAASIYVREFDRAARTRYRDLLPRLDIHGTSEID